MAKFSRSWPRRARSQALRLNDSVLATAAPVVNPPTMLRRCWTFVAWLLLILTVVASLWPVEPGPKPVHMDKLMHVLGYCGLMLWFMQIVPARRWPRLGLAMCMLGIGIEVLQGQTTYRSFSGLDIAANTIGILVSWVLARYGGAEFLDRIERRLATPP